MRVFLISSLLLASSQVAAFEIQDCDMWQQKANTFMTWRQQGLPIADAVKETAGNISRGLLLRAYAEPRKQGLEAQYKEIDRFSQQIHDECTAEQSAPQ